MNDTNVLDELELADVTGGSMTDADETARQRELAVRVARDVLRPAYMPIHPYFSGANQREITSESANRTSPIVAVDVPADFPGKPQ